MRGLTLLALGLCAVGSAAAQTSTQIIIRRPGQKDQVIQLDSTSKADQAKLKQHMAELTGTLRQHSIELGKQLNATHMKLIDTAFMKPLMLRSRELAATTAKLHSADLAKSLSQLGGQIKMLAMRPILGISIDYRPHDTDKYGAYVAAVTPGGPADKAGLRAGDVITSIAGKSLAMTEARDPNDDSSLPGVRLIDIMSKVESGKPLDVEYRRDNSTRKVKITPVEDESVMALAVPGRMLADSFTRFFNRDGSAYEKYTTERMVPTMDRQGFPMPPAAVARSGTSSFAFVTMGGPLGDLELAPLNEKLGNYFGTSEGVLVISTEPVRGGIEIRRDSAAAGAVRMRVGGSGGGAAAGGAVMATPSRAAVSRETFGLEAGDVIVSVDGRKVTSPAQLMRVLRTYDKGNEIKLQIMRQKRAETLTGKMP